MSALPSEAKMERITNIAMSRMADFATRCAPDKTYTESDIAAAVYAEPDGEVARFLAGVIASSIGLVAVLDEVEK